MSVIRNQSRRRFFETKHVVGCSKSRCPLAKISLPVVLNFVARRFDVPLPVVLNFVARGFLRRCPWFFTPTAVGTNFFWLMQGKICKVIDLFVFLRSISIRAEGAVSPLRLF